MLDSTTHIARALAAMDEPFVRYKILLNVYGRAPDSREIRILRDEVRESTLARTLLAEQDATGRIPLDPGDRWRGAHWVLYILADTGSTAGDKSLCALRDQVCDWLFSTEREELICGSIEGNALYYLHFLELDQGQTDELAARLVASFKKKSAKAPRPSARPSTSCAAWPSTPCAAWPSTPGAAMTPPPATQRTNSPRSCSPTTSTKSPTANP